MYDKAGSNIVRPFNFVLVFLILLFSNNSIEMVDELW